MKNLNKALSILYPEEHDRIPRYYMKRPKNKVDDLKELNKFLRKLNRLYKSKKKKSFSDNGKNKLLAKNQKQMCVPKMYYGLTKEGHIKFLEKYMQQINKEEVTDKPVPFGNCNIKEYIEKATDKYFKWMLSPEEKLTEAELKEFVTIFMDKMERKTGLKFDWQAVVHKNTAHPHVHIVINGKDRDGNEIEKIDPDYIKNYAREDCRNILTGMIGWRSFDLIQAAKDKNLVADRWTDLDKEIASKLKNVQISDRNYIPQEEGMTRMKSAFCISAAEISPGLSRRIEHLKKLKLCWFEKGNYFFESDWKESLISLGRYNMYLDSKKYIKEDSKLQLYTPELGRIEGKLKHIYYMDDENVWTNAALIENEQTKQAWYVPVFNPNIFNDYKIEDVIVCEGKPGRTGKLTPKLFNKTKYYERNNSELNV